MAKIKIGVYVETNRVGSQTADEIEVEVEDNATDREIEETLEEVAKEWVFNNIEWGYSRITE